MQRHHSTLLTSSLTTLALPTIVSAATDIAACCTRVPVREDLRPYQWDACYASYNQSETNPLRIFAAPILTTLQWCQQNCETNGMFQVSTTAQWLGPLASWVIPATGMLLLCPIAEHLIPPSDIARGWRGWMDEYIFNWLDAVVESG